MRSGVLVLAALLGITAGCRPPGYHSGDDAGDDDDSDGDDRDADDGAVVDAPRALDATGAADASGAACTATFVLAGYPGAGSVWLTGDFVGWATQPGAGALELAIDGSGAWSGVHDFAAGTYQYKYIVDSSTWITDPGNPDVTDDGLGGHNSVYRCAP